MNGTQILPLAFKIIECSNIQEKTRLLNSCQDKFKDLLACNIEVIVHQRAFKKQQALKAQKTKTPRKLKVKPINNSAGNLNFTPSSSTVASKYLSAIRKKLNLHQSTGTSYA